MRQERYSAITPSINLVLSYQAEVNRKITNAEVITLLEIQSLAKTHRTHCENYCNNGNDAQFEKATARIEKAINKRLQLLSGLTASYSGDPRGYTVHLHFKTTQVYNTWGGLESGYGI